MQYDDGRTDADKTVGNVKGRPMVHAQMKVQKVENRAQTHPVDKVAERSADDHAEPDLHGTHLSLYSHHNSAATINAAVRHSSSVPVAPESLNMEKLTPVFQA